MSNLPVSKNWGSAYANENRELVRQLDEMYSLIANVVNTKITKYVTSGADAPATSQLNRSFQIGDIYVRTDTNKAWIMTSRTNDQTVNWQIIT